MFLYINLSLSASVIHCLVPLYHICLYIIKVCPFSISGPLFGSTIVCLVIILTVMSVCCCRGECCECCYPCDLCDKIIIGRRRNRQPPNSCQTSRQCKLPHLLVLIGHFPRHLPIFCARRGVGNGVDDTRDFTSHIFDRI